MKMIHVHIDEDFGKEEVRSQEDFDYAQEHYLKSYYVNPQHIMKIDYIRGIGYAVHEFTMTDGSTIPHIMKFEEVELTEGLKEGCPRQ